MGEPIQSNIFVDTNVLINDFFYRVKAKEYGKKSSLAIQYLKSKPTVKIYIASFSVIQLISTLDKAKISKEELKTEVNRILTRYKLVDLTAKDFGDALSIEYKDTEDAVQYTLSQKVRCQYILTENVKDFKIFGRITIVKPKAIRKIFIA